MAIIRKSDFRNENRTGGGWYDREPYWRQYEGAEDDIGCWSPAVDIMETSEAVEMHVELPGVAKDEVSVNIEGGVLTISGDRQAPGERSESKYLRIERCYGSFSRSFSISNQIDQEQVSADLECGMLTVKLPFREDSRPREINVQVR